MTDRGTSNTAVRGSAESRRARRRWIVETFGIMGIIVCPLCNVPMLADEFQVDRWPTPGCRGGTYARCNIRPICQPCNIELGNALRDGILV